MLNPFIVMTDSVNTGCMGVLVRACAHARVSESILPHCVYSSGIARSSITEPSSFPNTGGLHLCETLTHAVIAATGLHWHYRLNNCQITMAASGPELTPCPWSLAKACKKKKKNLSLPHAALHPRWTRRQLGKWWYARDGCIWGRESSQGSALGERGCRAAVVGTAPTVRPPAYSHSCPGYNGWLGAKVSTTGLARDRSQLTDRTLVARRLKLKLRDEAEFPL